MWIFCCGMRRSGSTLQYQIATDLVTRRGIGEGLGYVLPEDFEKLAQEHGGDGRFKIVKTHAFLPAAGPLLRRGQAKGLYSYRDIRDVIVSLMTMQNVPFAHLRDQGMIYALLKEYDDWLQAGNILVSRYESMVEDLAGEISRMASFIGVRLEEGEAETMATEYSLERQKERINQFSSEQLVETSVGTKVHPTMLLHHNHISSGRQGRWQQVLSRSEVALVEHIARDWMRDRGYPFSQSWFLRKATGVRFHLRNRVRSFVRGKDGR